MTWIWGYASRSALVGMASYLLLAVLLGITLATVIDASQSTRIVEAELLERLERLELQAVEDRRAHREANQADHDDICRLIYDIVSAAPSLQDRAIERCRSHAHD
jgi:hypothetical protein